MAADELGYGGCLNNSQSNIKQLFSTIGIDGAVAFVLITRVWQAASGLITLLLLARYVTPDVQGYYYTFSSLLALQSFVELGMYIVIVSVASREWSGLRLSEEGSVLGDPIAQSRLASLLRLVAKWYAVASLLFVILVGTGGYIFLDRSTAHTVEWHAPWLVCVGLAAAQLWFLPLLSLLEGCNQVVDLNRFRLVQTVCESAVIWLLLVFGNELWALTGMLGARVASTAYFICRRHYSFFASLRETAGSHSMSWRNEIFPMQWRLAVQGLVNYFAYALYVPVMFHFYGPKEAGQMGMTLQIVSVVQLMALAWVQPKVPISGVLIAQRKFAELDALWRRIATASLVFYTFLALTILFAVSLVHEFYSSLGARILDTFPTGLFLLAYGFLHISNLISSYLRAYGKEPFLFLGLLSGVLIGCLVYILGSLYGPTGAASGLLASVALFLVPFGVLIFTRRRAQWQE